MASPADHPNLVGNGVLRTASGGGRPALPAELAAQLHERAALIVSGLRRSGCHTTGDLAHLTVEPIAAAHRIHPSTATCRSAATSSAALLDRCLNSTLPRHPMSSLGTEQPRSSTAPPTSTICRGHRRDHRTARRDRRRSGSLARNGPAAYRRQFVRSGSGSAGRRCRSHPHRISCARPLPRSD